MRACNPDIAASSIIHEESLTLGNTSHNWLTGSQNKGTLCANYWVFTLTMPNPCAEKWVQSPENSQNEL